ncbi:MAG: hypothetical protein ACFFDU_08590 [Candidatus Thorarchaeota archaeon]
MVSRKDLSSWVKQFILQITNEWDWSVDFSIDIPEKNQTCYQIFLSLNRLHLSVVVLFDKQKAEEGDVADLREKINRGLILLKELADERVVV